MDTKRPVPGPHPRQFRFIRTRRKAWVIYHADGRIAAIGQTKRVNR